jgi:hypothetical protein
MSHSNLQQAIVGDVTHLGRGASGQNEQQAHAAVPASAAIVGDVNQRLARPQTFSSELRGEVVRHAQSENDWFPLGGGNKHCRP